MVKPKLQLLDDFGRNATNLRISVTDRCNLTCRYCTSLAIDRDWLRNDELLTFSEIRRISKLAAELGVNQLRITGGEPLLRPNISSLIQNLKILPGIKRISMTTNGVLLKNHLSDLEKAGLSSINISLDTLNPTKFTQITGKNNFKTIMNNIIRAKNSTIDVKVNCVALKGFSEDELLDFVNFAINNEITVRFIEFMPFKGNDWLPSKILSVKEMKKTINQKYNMIPEDLEHPSQTSRNYRLEGYPGKVGFIASVTESFCQWCNRLRLTADGYLRTCLSGKEETPLRTLLRTGISDEKLKEIIVKTVRMKPKEHVDFLNPNFRPSSIDREMIDIGG
ncbi:MAG: GTP 3',8-cyclase MoaA [Candidatus Hodarchaeota archaeon]